LILNEDFRWSTQCSRSFLCYTSDEHNLYGQFSVKTPTLVHPLLKVGKPWQICWWILVYRMYGPVSPQSDTCFLVQNRSICNIFTFHLEKHIIKTWNFAQLELKAFWRKKYKTLKIQPCWTQPCFFRHDLINWRFAKKMPFSISFYWIRFSDRTGNFT
jgi:hypothetical protein